MAYNRWVAEYCAYSPTRLFGIAAVPQRDIARAITMLDEIRDLGHVGVFLRPNPSVEGTLVLGRDVRAAVRQARGPGPGGRLPPLPDARHARRDPLARPGRRRRAGREGESRDDAPRQGSDTFGLKNIFFSQALGNPFDMQIVMATLICGGVLERHPKLQGASSSRPTAAGSCRSSSGSITTTRSSAGKCRSMTMKPSEYFKRQCWISFDPDESTLRAHRREPAGRRGPDHLGQRLPAPRREDPGRGRRAARRDEGPARPPTRRGSSARTRSSSTRCPTRTDLVSHPAREPQAEAVRRGRGEGRLRRPLHGVRDGGDAAGLHHQLHRPAADGRAAAGHQARVRAVRRADGAADRHHVRRGVLARRSAGRAARGPHGAAHGDRGRRRGVERDHGADRRGAELRAALRGAHRRGRSGVGGRSAGSLAARRLLPAPPARPRARAVLGGRVGRDHARHVDRRDPRPGVRLARGVHDPGHSGTAGRARSCASRCASRRAGASTRARRRRASRWARRSATCGSGARSCG